MTAHNNNMLDSSMANKEIKNKGFLLLDAMFKEHGWHSVRNEMNWLCYSKMGYETDLFDIKIDKNSIHVSIPIKNSPFQYHTSFNDYFQASEYVEARFFDFIHELKKID